MKKLLTVTELSKYINIHKRTLFRMIADGKFPVEPVMRNPNRWSVEQIDAWLRGEK